VHCATRTFQALRIEVNLELKHLQQLLDMLPAVIRPGGRVGIISFHSLEDRIVKRFIRRMARGADIPRGVPLTEAQVQRRLRAIGKACKPSAAEIEANPRARSAVMRVAEKLANGGGDVRV
jgi:16S rRNA (cytosine1402-N4)-methyltransferase